MPSYEAVLEQAEQLSYEEREKLVRDLIAGLRPPGDDLSEAHWKAVWGAEIERRLQAYEQGRVQGVPWRESVQQLRDALAANYNPLQ